MSPLLCVIRLRGLLTRTEYGNGLTISYTYDVLDRVTEVKFRCSCTKLV